MAENHLVYELTEIDTEASGQCPLVLRNLAARKSVPLAFQASRIAQPNLSTKVLAIHLTYAARIVHETACGSLASV